MKTDFHLSQDLINMFKQFFSQFEDFRIIYLNIDKSLLHVRKETDYPEEFFL